MKKKRSSKLFLEDILDAMSRIEQYTKNLSFADVEKNTMLTDALVKNFIIIGEATNNIPQEITEKFPHIPWKRMIGLRNIVIHDYYETDLPMLWDIVKNYLPETKTQIAAMIENVQESPGTN